MIKELYKERPKRAHLDVRVLGHLVSFVEHQFGDRVVGRSYHERINGDRVGNWEFEILVLMKIYNEMTVAVHNSDESLSIIVCDDLTFPYYEKMLDLLKPWSVYFNSSPSARVDSMDKDKVNHLLRLSSKTERQIALIYIHRSEFDLAQNYCQISLSHARLFEGEEEMKTDLLCSALRANCSLRQALGNYADSTIAFAEEAYDCAAIAYNPVHPKVQDAAGTLIECLTRKGDFYNAERFAEATLDSLKDPKNGLDQESQAVADGYFDLANVIHRQEGDLVKAETLARESLRIVSKLCTRQQDRLGISTNQLANILQSQGKIGGETLELFERSLSICTKQSGPDSTDVAAANGYLGQYHHHLAAKQRTAVTRKEHLRLSISFYKETVRIYTKIYGPNNPMTIDVSSALSIVSREISEA
jgi:tetratricopeptide (TPR) repeat protein